MHRTFTHPCTETTFMPVSIKSLTTMSSLKFIQGLFLRLSFVPSSHYHLPDFFSVHIPAEETDGASPKRVVVEIISKPIVKPYIGGFKTKRKGKNFWNFWKSIHIVRVRFHSFVCEEYHDAYTQTGPVYEAIKWSGITSRDSQAGQKDQCLVNIRQVLCDFEQLNW